MIEGGRFDLRHGQDELVRFPVTGGAGSSEARLTLSASAQASTDDLVLTSAGGDIVITDVGDDAQVDVTFNDVAETLPVGPRWFELWLTKNGHPKPVKVGVAMIHASRWQG